MKFLNFFKSKNFFSFVALSLVMLVLPDLAHASASTGMPYDSALTKLKESLTGPVAQTVAVIGIVATGATLIFGGEISGFLKSVVYLILVCSLLIAGTKIISVFGVSTGAEVAMIENSHQYVMPAEHKLIDVNINYNLG